MQDLSLNQEQTGTSATKHLQQSQLKNLVIIFCPFITFLNPLKVTELLTKASYASFLIRILWNWTTQLKEAIPFINSNIMELIQITVEI